MDGLLEGSNAVEGGISESVEPGCPAHSTAVFSGSLVVDSDGFPGSFVVRNRDCV